MMKYTLKFIFSAMVAIVFVGINSQSMAQEVSISKSLGLFVFPANDQSAEQIETDEIACYKWATEQTGVDPINPPQIQAEQVDTSPDGSAVRSAARGAAAGAAIGAIAGDAGKGAAIGAAAGGMAGRRGKKHGDAVQQQQANETATKQEEELMNNFKKAFTTCLTAKGYTVN
jgi:hypothetical protein